MKNAQNMNKTDIERAIKTFDSEYRDLPEWAGWEARRSQKYVLVHKGKSYPPKRICSIATETPVQDLMGGKPTNNALRGLGFTIESTNGLAAPNVGEGELPDFIVGESYLRAMEITGKFGGSAQSGISPSKRVPAIFLFTGDTGEQYGYRDDIDESGVMNYTGEGQYGDMKMMRGNAAIANHAAKGRALYLFEAKGKGKPCIYLGEFFYLSHFTRTGPDKVGEDRQVIVFRLLEVGATEKFEQAEQLVEEAEEDSPGNLSELRARAISAATAQNTTDDAKTSVRKAYQRSRQVKEWVLARAGGDCELCDKSAPFARKADNTPYLEPHHINRLSDGGLDHPTFVGAICPTCHRHIHHGTGGHEQNEKLRDRIAAKERQYDSKNG